MTVGTFGARFLRHMKSIVTVEAWTGANAYGDATYDTLRYYHAYINATGEYFRAAQGQSIVSSATIYLYPLECNADGSAKTGAQWLAAIPEQSRFTWPDASVPGGVAHPVPLKVNGLTDASGLQMYQIHF